MSTDQIVKDLFVAALKYYASPASYDANGAPEKQIGSRPYGLDKGSVARDALALAGVASAIDEVLGTDTEKP